MEIDSLELRIKSDATSAVNHLDGIVKKLDLVSNSLKGLGTNSHSLTQFSTSVRNLADSMSQLKVSGITSRDFSNLASNIKKLTTIDTQKIQMLSNSLKNLSSGLNYVSSTNYDGQNLANIAAGLNKLGGVKATQALSNLPALSQALSQFATTMNGIQQITFDAESLAKLATALSKLGGAKVTQSVSNLPILKTYVASFVRELNTLGTVSFDTVKFVELVKAIGKLGAKTSIQASSNLPNITKGIKQLVTELNAMPMVSDNVLKLIEALGKLSSISSAKIGSIGNLTQTGRKGSNALKNSLNGLIGTLNRSEKGFKSFAHYAGKLYANFFLLRRAISGVGRAITSSMDYIEEYNYFNVTLGKIASTWKDKYTQYGYEDADAYSESFRKRMTATLGKMTGFEVSADGTLKDLQTKSLGLDMTALMNYQAGLLQVTNAMGQTGEASVTTAKLLSMLAGDMSSFRNTDLTQVMQNFQSALLGQSRAVYKYGIDITQATLAQKALELGISKSVKSMTQSEKAQLRTLVMIEQSRVAWGDLANTIESPSNQLRLLQNNFKSLSRTIGNIFIPVVAKVLPYVNGLVIAIRRLFEWTGKMLGVDLSDIIDNSGTGFSDAFDDIEETADDATDSVKALKRELMGFDEINKLSDNTSNSKTSSNSGGDIDLTSQLTKALEDYEKVWNDAFDKMEDKSNNVADNIIDTFKKGKWEAVGTTISSELRKTLESIPWENVYKGTKGFAKNLALFLNGLFQPDTFYTVGKTVAKLLNTGIYAKLEFAKNFDFKKFGKSLANGLNGFFRNYDFKALAKSLNKWVDGLEETIGSFLKNLSWKDIKKAAGNFLGTLELDTLAVLIAGLSFKYAPGVLAGANSTLSSTLGSKIGAISLGLIIGDLIVSQIDTETIADELSDAFIAIVDDMKSGDFKFNILGLFETPSYNETKSFIESMGRGLSKAWDSVFGKGEGKNFLQLRYDITHTKTLAEVKQDWKKFTEAWKDKYAFFSIAYPDKASSIKDMWKDLSKWWKDKKAAFGIDTSGAKKTLDDFFKNVNPEVKLVFTPTKLNDSTLKNLLTNQSPYTWGTLGIQKKADGGAVGTGQLFIAREAGAELVGNVGGSTAVMNNQQIVESVARGVAQAVGQVLMSQGRNQNINVTLEGDANKFFRVMQQESRSYKIQTGRPAF